ncbi:restriction endonuclease [Herbidospora galbida]|uniref:Restriction endonuclease n=1 Tax=Herbidospora galbida TaxID=2575442 RepID=A0A4U3ME08_9ACTN|nr:restriction endonuclease [Herbidospora galbida]TKK86980.1 restriction endonuclease [Herbidospora galbida]
MRPRLLKRLPDFGLGTPQTVGQWTAFAIAVGVTGWLAFRLILAVIGFLLDHWYLALLLSLVLIGTTVAWWRQRVRAEQIRRRRLGQLRLTLPQIDGMRPVEFELAVRDLMDRDGLTARHTGRRGDKAADVIARDAGARTIVVQCKHTTMGRRVGAPVLYAVNGTAAALHRAQLAVIVTNGGFTRDARQTARELGIHLVGRDDLERWATHGVGFHRLLRLRDPSADRDAVRWPFSAWPADRFGVKP